MKESIEGILQSHNDIDHKKLLWKCRRGSKELDIILTYYLEHHYRKLESTQKQAFSNLLEYSDPDIQDLLIGMATSDDSTLNHVIEMTRDAYQD